MASLARQRFLLGLVSIVGTIATYTLIAGAWHDPELLPSPRALLATSVSLVTGQLTTLGAGYAHPSGQIGHLLDANVTLQGALLGSTTRVLIGIGIGAPLGLLLGLAMGWSRRLDDYVHPVYVLLRSIPPLALITYAMLWFGHGEAHLLIPIVYAVATTMVIPTYHGVHDLADVYVRAARALGAGRTLLFLRVVLPAASPFVLAGLRYALVIGWMTTVGAEMLMGEDGIGHLIVAGGLWSSRLEIRVDPAVVIVGIVALATIGYAMDLAARVIGDRLTFWARAPRP